MGTLKYDAEDYHRTKVEEFCDKIKLEKKRMHRGNSGFAFVSF
jgi:hypothetical protein